MSAIADFDVLKSPLQGATLLEASAGTGKTWNICGLYMRLLLEKKLDVRQILVVTFTNAATAELRERIRQRIVEVHDYIVEEKKAPDTPVHDFVQQLRASNDDAPLIHRLKYALQSFDEAAIFTIHGFCQRALADAAFAAGQPFSLELAPDDSDLLLEAVQDFWRRHIAADSMSGELATFLLQKKDSPEKYAKLLKRHLAKPLARIEWPSETTEIKVDGTALERAFVEAKGAWEASQTAITEQLQQAWDKDQLKKNIYREGAIADATSKYQRLFQSGDPLNEMAKESRLALFSTGKIVQGTKQKHTPPEHRFFDLAEDYLSQREALENDLKIARQQLIRQMLEETSSSLPQRKRERGLQSFDDLLGNLHTALSGGDFPWLAATLRERYPAALVDEFQDTDPLQYAIFNGIYSGSSNNALFFVGDPKQAIYRFRNADLETYFRAREQASGIYSIRNNQRSTKGMIDAANGIFSANPLAFMHDALDFQKTGYGRNADVVMHDSSASSANLHLWMLPKNDDGEYIERNDAIQQSANATATEISRLLAAADQEQVSIDSQPLTAGQIAVLVRSHKQGRLIRQALSRLEIDSVEMSQASVFKSADAEEVERILTAIWFPNRLSLLRSALATELLGYDAADIFAISDDETRLMEFAQTFAAYRERWLTHGIAYVYRHMLSDQSVSERMLPRPDGERRMTNLLHLGELLQQASELHLAPDALLRWLQTRRREDGGDETSQLRLESDQNLVKIMTIHKSKGLEFPVVFCPFLWDGYRNTRNDLEGREYHDARGNTVIDYRPDADGDAEISDQIRHEADAEDLRLMYVALTRAAHRCYLVAGCYSYKHGNARVATPNQSKTSLLNWLVAGDGLTPEQWKNGNRKEAPPEVIEQAWQQLAESCDGISMQALPSGLGKTLAISGAGKSELSYQKLKTRKLNGWRISSYSGLSRGATHENAASDHDNLVAPAPEAEQQALAGNDILLFPKGASAGDCIHRAFELCDFSMPLTYEDAIARALSEHPQPTGDTAKEGGDLTAMLRQMMHDVLHTSLADGIRLYDVIPQRRLSEMGFHLSRTSLTDNELNQTLQALGYAVPRLRFSDLDGYLKGFIDLIFEHDGRYYILDWKSNYLGDTQADYGPEMVAEAMAGNGYHLQYLLYTVALHRYLAQRIPAYRYDTHFGGVLYLFVRGVRPEWQNVDGTSSGVFFERPDERVIERLDALFHHASEKAA